MSDAFFPFASLPGVKLKSRTPMRRTEIQEGDSGMEYRISRYSAPRYRYSFDAEWLRDTLSEATILLGFWDAHGGMRDSFLLLDPVDGRTRRVRFDDDEPEFERKTGGLYSCQFDLVTVVG